MDVGWDYKNSNSHPSDMRLPARTHLLNFPKLVLISSSPSTGVILSTPSRTQSISCYFWNGDVFYSKREMTEKTQSQYIWFVQEEKTHNVHFRSRNSEVWTCHLLQVHDEAPSESAHSRAHCEVLVYTPSSHEQSIHHSPHLHEPTVRFWPKLHYPMNNP